MTRVRHLRTCSHVQPLRAGRGVFFVTGIAAFPCVSLLGYAEEALADVRVSSRPDQTLPISVTGDAEWISAEAALAGWDTFTSEVLDDLSYELIAPVAPAGYLSQQRLELNAGYSSNVLLATPRLSGSFVGAAADSFWLWAKERHLFNLMLYGTIRTYEQQHDEAIREWSFLINSEWTYAIGTSQTIGTELYFNGNRSPYDPTDPATAGVIVPDFMEVFSFGAKAFYSMLLARAVELEVFGKGGYTDYRDWNYDHSNAGGGVEITAPITSIFSARISYEASHLRYDEEVRRGSTGLPLPGGLLRVWRHRLEAGVELNPEYAETLLGFHQIKLWVERHRDNAGLWNSLDIIGTQLSGHWKIDRRRVFYQTGAVYNDYRSRRHSLRNPDTLDQVRLSWGIGCSYTGNRWGIRFTFDDLHFFSDDKDDEFRSTEIAGTVSYKF